MIYWATWFIGIFFAIVIFFIVLFCVTILKASKMRKSGKVFELKADWRKHHRRP